MNVFILGPAGSGKSLLTANFASYLTDEGYKVRTVNLDPRVLSLGYKADFDVRENFTIEGIMRREGLGPNGAFLKAMDMLAEVDLPRLQRQRLRLIRHTRPARTLLVQRFRKEDRREAYGRLLLFLGDLSASRRNLLGFFLYTLTARYTLGAETLAILNKVDLLNPREVREVERIHR